jgi:hypothetical protein
MRHMSHVKRTATYDGNPVHQVSTKAWYKALKRAGIEKFRWHDLRHTWASWHVQNGTPLHVLQELGGWETPAMVGRYAHLATGDLAAYVGRVELMGPQKIRHSNFRAENRRDRRSAKNKDVSSGQRRNRTTNSRILSPKDWYTPPYAYPQPLPCSAGDNPSASR